MDHLKLSACSFWQPWTALAAVTAESPLLTTFSSSSTFSNSDLTFELVECTNLLAVSKEMHNWDYERQTSSIYILTKLLNSRNSLMHMREHNTNIKIQKHNFSPTNMQIIRLVNQLKLCTIIWSTSLCSCLPTKIVKKSKQNMVNKMKFRRSQFLQVLGHWFDGTTIIILYQTLHFQFSPKKEQIMVKTCMLLIS